MISPTCGSWIGAVTWRMIRQGCVRDRSAGGMLGSAARVGAAVEPPAGGALVDLPGADGHRPAQPVGVRRACCTSSGYGGRSTPRSGIRPLGSPVPRPRPSFDPPWPPAAASRSTWPSSTSLSSCSSCPSRAAAIACSSASASEPGEPASPSWPSSSPFPSPAPLASLAGTVRLAAPRRPRVAAPAHRRSLGRRGRRRRAARGHRRGSR